MREVNAERHRFEENAGAEERPINQNAASDAAQAVPHGENACASGENQSVARPRYNAQ